MTIPRCCILYNWFFRYECGLARRFWDTEAEKNYTERWMTCNWNTTWTLHDSLDECIWVQCLNPPMVRLHIGEF